MSLKRSRILQSDHRRAAASSEHFNEETSVSPLTLSTVRQLASESGIFLSGDDLEQVNLFINDDPDTQKLKSFIEGINSLYASQLAGAGLTNIEKNLYNGLNDQLAECNPQDMSSISAIRQHLKDKIDLIRELKLKINYYRHIMLLYKTYITILNDPATWKHGLEEVREEWSRQRHFACCSSEELLRLYEIYNDFSTKLISFAKYIEGPGKKLSVQARLAIQNYCIVATGQIHHFRMAAIDSMSARLHCAERRCDLYYDDIIHDTVEKIELEIRHRIIKEEESKKVVFDQLRVRRRRGMTYHCCRQFIMCIRKFCREPETQAESLEFFKKVTLRGMEGLSILTPPVSWGDVEMAAINHDPVVIFLANNFDRIKRLIFEKMLLATDSAILLVSQLDAYITEVRQYYQQRVQESKKNSNPHVERFIQACEHDFGELLVRVQLNLLHQFDDETGELISNAINGDLTGFPRLDVTRSRLVEFRNAYDKRYSLDTIELRIDLKVIILQYIDDHPGVILHQDTRKNLADLLVHVYCWPVSSKNNKEVVALHRILLNRLGVLMEFYTRPFMINRYSHFTWIGYFIDEAVKRDQPSLESNRQLAKRYHAEWVEFLPLKSHVLAESETIYIPLVIENLIKSETLMKASSTRRAFLLANRELILQINRTGTYIQNVVIPYVSTCPFINLQNLSSHSSYIKVMGQLIEQIGCLRRNIHENSGKSLLKYKTDRLMLQLLTECEAGLERVHREWQRGLFENIHTQLGRSKLDDYLRHDTDMINSQGVDFLVTNIRQVFQYEPYREKLIDAVLASCAGILIELGREMLLRKITDPGFQHYVNILGHVSRIENFGTRIIGKLSESQQIAGLLNAHLVSFDGAQSVVGTLITTLYPADDISKSTALNDFILPYARKRLAYIRLNGGDCIQQDDIDFFQFYSGISECHDLFVQEQGYYEDAVIFHALDKHAAAWETATARIIEMFGSPVDISVYRARCVIPLMLNDSPGQPECDKWAEFMGTRYRYELPLIDPSYFIVESGQAFQYLLEHYIENENWTIIREHIISSYDLNQLRQFHYRCLYKLLNSRAPEYGLWLNRQLKYRHPNDLFGEDGAQKICEYAVSLINQAESACHDFNIDEDEFVTLNALIHNLKYLKDFFKQMENAAGRDFLENVSMVEVAVRLAMMIKKTFKAFAERTTGVVYDLRSTIRLAPQFIGVMLDVEKNNMVSLFNAGIYLDFLDNLLKNISSDEDDSLSDYFLDGLFNLYLTITAHLKNLLIKLANSESDYLSAPEMILSLANALDDTDNIDARKSVILENYDDIPAIRQIIEKFIHLCYEINRRRNDIHEIFKRHLLRDAAVLVVYENPVRLAIVCVNRFFQLEKQLGLTSYYVDHYAKTLCNIMTLIPLRAFGEFAQHFIESHERIIRISLNVSSGGKLTFGLFGGKTDMQENSSRLLASLMTEFQSRLSAYILLVSIENYMYSKMKLKSGERDGNSIFTSASDWVAEMDDTERLPFIKRTLKINKDASARKALLLLRLHHMVTMIYAGHVKMDEAKICIENMLDEVSRKPAEYKSKDFTRMLQDALVIIQSHNIRELMGGPVENRTFLLKRH